MRKREPEPYSAKLTEKYQKQVKYDLEFGGKQW